MNAGSGAERVVVVPVLVGLVVAPPDGVVPVAVLVVFALVVGVVGVVCETGGALDTVTVFVPETHAASNADAHTAVAAAESALTPIRRIDPSYSPFGTAFLAWRRPRPPGVHRLESTQTNQSSALL